MLLSLSEDTQTACRHQSWRTNNVVFLYRALPSRGYSHGKVHSVLCHSSYMEKCKLFFLQPRRRGGGFINHIPIQVYRMNFPQNININLDLWSSFYNLKSYLSCVGNLLMKKFWSLKKIQDKTSDKVETAFLAIIS